MQIKPVGFTCTVFLQSDDDGFLNVGQSGVMIGLAFDNSKRAVKLFCKK
jgi:hypothetical protein